MRIAFLSPWQNVVQRGVEGVVREITKRLRKRHEVDIFSTGCGNGIVTVNADIRNSGLLRAYENISRMFGFSRLFETGFPPIGPGDMQAFYFAHKAFKKMIEEKLNYDAVSIFCGLYGDVCAAWYRRNTGIPFIHNDHGGSVQDQLAILTKPDAVICITPLIVEYHKKRFLGRRTKIHMIPNGVDLDVFKPEGEKTTLVDLGKMEHPIVLSTSALSPVKRLHLLIEAMAKLSAGTLIFTSDGPLKEEVVSFGKKKLGSRFVYLGVVSHEELPKIYRSCDVFSLPSYWEGFPLVILEAMASGLPVVTTNDELRKWILGDCGGILVDPTDTEAYACALRTAYETGYDSSVREYITRFSWDTIAQRYEKIIVGLERGRSK